MHSHTGLTQFFSGESILRIDDQKIEKIVVKVGDACNGNSEALRCHEDSRRTADGVPDNDRTDGYTAGAAFAEGFANAGHGENRRDAGDWITGGEHDEISGTDSLDHSGSGLGVRSSGEANRLDGILIPALDEIFFETEVTDGSEHSSFDARVAHGQDSRFDSELAGDFCSGVAQGFAIGQQFGAKNMGGEVAIAGVKPGRLSELTHGVEAKESVAFHAPAALLAEFTGQHVDDGIEIRRNVESPPEQIVTGVDDDGQLIGRNNLGESIDKFCAAGAAGENRDHAAPRA